MPNVPHHPSMRLVTPPLLTRPNVYYCTLLLAPLTLVLLRVQWQWSHGMRPVTALLSTVLIAPVLVKLALVVDNKVLLCAQCCQKASFLLFLTTFCTNTFSVIYYTLSLHFISSFINCVDRTGGRQQGVGLCPMLPNWPNAAWALFLLFLTTFPNTVPTTSLWYTTLYHVGQHFHLSALWSIFATVLIFHGHGRSFELWGLRDCFYLSWVKVPIVKIDTSWEGAHNKLPDCIIAF